MEKGKGCFLKDPFEERSRKRSYEFHENVEGDWEDDVDLSLGLSLHGRFGVDPNKILNSSSSVTNCVLPSTEHKKMINEIQFPIIKTPSLPRENEVELRKKEEIQSLKYVDADNNKWDRMKKIEVVKESDVDFCSNCHCSKCRKFKLSSSGGSGSSGVLEVESKRPHQGPKGSTDVERPASDRSLQRKQKLVAATRETTNEKLPVLSEKIAKETEEMLKKIMLTMPRVSTRGGIPNGKKTEGFLYGYKTGEDPKILCVCHGTFLTPAEFVKHAGGGDEDHPLKHIAMHPSPFK